jgi:hypothetical protein
VLRHTQRIVVTRRKVGLKILFYVVFGAKLVAQFNHPARVVAPVCRPRNFLQIVRAADFVQIDKPVRLLNNGKAGFYVEGRLQADPGEDAVLVKRLQCVDAVTGRRGVALTIAAQLLAATSLPLARRTSVRLLPSCPGNRATPTHSPVHYESCRWRDPPTRLEWRKIRSSHLAIGLPRKCLATN